jgi:hypothetical protein
MRARGRTRARKTERVATCGAAARAAVVAYLRVAVVGKRESTGGARSQSCSRGGRGSRMLPTRARDNGGHRFCTRIQVPVSADVSVSHCAGSLGLLRSKCGTKILRYSARFCVSNCALPSRLRGGRRETKKVITRGEGYTYIAALRSPDLRHTTKREGDTFVTVVTSNVCNPK